MGSDVWTPDRVELLRKLLPSGMPASQIAGELGGGLSRNAVIGKALRLGLDFENTRGGPRGGTRTSRNAAMSSRAVLPNKAPVRVRLERPFVAPVDEVADVMRVVAREAAEAAEAVGRGVTLLGLEKHHCRWPIGDPRSPDFQYCGGRRVADPAPYCARHMRISIDPHRKA